MCRLLSNTMLSIFLLLFFFAVVGVASKPSLSATTRLDSDGEFTSSVLRRCGQLHCILGMCDDVVEGRDGGDWCMGNICLI